MAFLTGFTTPFVGGPSFFTGTGSSSLVPDVFPVGINGRPYMIDMKSQQFRSAYEPRIRDSVDQSPVQGEAAISPGGLWRRSQASWHLGAGQEYADTADETIYRYYKSRGLDPWTRGQLTLLNDTKVSLSSANTNLYMAQNATELYVADSTAIKYTTDPYAGTPSWTTVSSTSATAARSMTSDGVNIYTTHPGTTSSFGLWKVDASHVASNVAHANEYGVLGYVKGFLMMAGAGADAAKLWTNPSGNNPTVYYTHPNASWTWTGFAGGYNAIYASGYAGKTSAIYKLTIKTDGTLNVPIVALDLPTGELVTTIQDYLGFLLIGTNKGVRFASSDTAGSLTVGKLLPTTGSVYSIAADGRHAWYGWSSYETGVSGVGRLDLAEFTAPNTPAFASDLMYASSANDVQSVASFGSKRVFTISGIGVIAEDSANKVATGTLETGIFTWGIPDRKFVAKFDVRTRPLAGSISASVAIDNDSYQSLGTMSTANDTEDTFDGKESKLIEGKFKLTFTRSATTTSTGPTLVRWSARAYAAPVRSKFFVVPILLHKRVTIRNRDYFFDVIAERDFINSYIEDARVITYQEGPRSYPVTVEDIEWVPVDCRDLEWDWEGTLTVTMRSITD
jgi:hypothetical protein